MTSREFKERLSRRARRARVPQPEEIEPFETYFRLLARWNLKINLTALPLEVPTDETFDRLFIEPLVAASLLPNRAATWFDLGSGGGSPAVPLKLVRPSLSLTLVESKTRKAAFLREVVRVLRLPATTVANVRLEELTTETGTVEYVTVRAVKPDPTLVSVASRLLRIGGEFLVFSNDEPIGHPDFEVDGTAPKTSAAPIVTSYRRVFHVEQKH